MQQTNAAQQQPGEKQALTTSATQNKPKSLTRDLIPIPKLKHPPNQHRDTIAAGGSIIGETEAVVIRIRDTPSPPTRTGSATHATPQVTHRTQALAEVAEQRSKLSP